MIISQTTHHKFLIGIVALNLVSTWLHYIHNAIFLDCYPGPDWFTPQMIILTVALMSVIGILGYWLYSRSAFLWSYVCLGLYSITSISSPGHYLYPIVVPMSTTMHSLIWLDALSGVTLISFLLWSGLFAQEWRSAIGDA
jgi:hypothetical protein